MGSVTKADIDQLVADRTVAREFVDTVAKYGDRTAIRWMQPDGSLGSVTFAEFGDKAARAAAGLISLGVQPGDRVVVNGLQRIRPGAVVEPQTAAEVAKK